MRILFSGGKTEMKRIISITMALLLTVSALTIGIMGLTASADGSTGNNFLLSHPGTANLNDQTSNPYSQPRGQNFSLSTMNELYYYASYDSKYYSRLFDEMSTSATKSGDYYWMKHINMHNSNGFDAAPSSGDNYLSKYRLSYVQAVGFDPLGNGRKDHIAFIGYSNYKSGNSWLYYTYIVVQDLRANSSGSDGNRRMYAYELDRSSWARNRDLPYYLGSAYFAIAAGDFDADGKDTLVAYCPSDTNSVKVSEINFNGSAFTCSTLKKIEDLRSDTADLLTGRESNWEFKPTVSFAVGDFDADGIDNLAISTGFGNPASYDNDSSTDGLSKDNTSVKKFVTNVSIMNYDKNTSTWSIASQDYMYNRGALIRSDNDSKTYRYDVMHMGAITAGDINNNGYDDIIAVGFTSYSDDNDHCRVKEWNNSPRTDVYDLGDIDKTQYAYSVISYDSANKVYQRTALGKIKMNNFEAHNFKDDSNSMWPQIQIAAAYTNGHSNPAEVFINGEIFNGKSGELITQYKPQIFTQTFTTLMDGGTNADMSFTAQVAAGNFDNNNAGREQFAYTIAFKENNARDYAMYLGYVGGCEFDDDIQNGKVVDYGQLVNYGNSDIRDKGDGSASGNKVHNTDKANASQIMYNNGDHWTDDSGKCLNGVICAVDWDSDGLIGKFSKHGYITSDPTPVAVLQVSPYFDSLMKAGVYGTEQSEAGTTYKIGYSFEKTTSKGNSVSFGVGVTGEIELKHVKMSAEIGYSLDWNETFEKSVQKEYEKEFTVDSVLVTIVPVDIYSYDVYNPQTGRYISDGYTVRTPSSPVYQVMTIAEYNAAVAEYNAYIDSSNAPGAQKANKLKQIQYGTLISDSVQLPANAEGNPYVYAKWTTENSNKMDLLSDPINMGYAGASISASYTYSTGNTHSTEMAHGFNFSFTIMFGGEVANDVGLWGGGYVNLDYSESKGNSVSISNSEGCTGEVVDPKANEQVSYNELQKYAFQWRLAQWTSKLVQGTDDITPVVGYALSNVISPSGPPKDLEAVYNYNEQNAANSSITLTWKKPDPIPYGPGVKGYNVYDDGEKVNGQIVLPGNSDTVTYTIGSVEYGSKHHFTVKAITQGTEALSTPSNEAVLGWVSNAVSIETIVKDTSYVSSDGLTDRYIITLSDGTESDFFVKNGKDGANGTSVSSGYINNDGNLVITLSDGNVLTLGNVHGSDGRGIANVSLKSQTDNVDTYTITFTDGTTKDFSVTNGKDGVGIGNVVVNNGNLVVTLTDGTSLNLGTVKGNDGVTPKLRIESDNTWYVSYDNGNTWTSLGGVATVVDGITPQLKIGDDNSWCVSYDNGLTWESLGVAATAPGPQGRGISDISKTGTENGENIYTVTYSDGTTSTFSVANGKDGTGVSGASIDGSGNLVIALTDGSTIALGNIIGADGITPQMKIGSDGNWYVSYDNGTNWTSTGASSAGRGILDIAYYHTEDNDDVYRITYTDNTTSTFKVAKGSDGVSISAVRLDGDDLIISFSNGESTNIGSVRGATGQTPKLEIRDDNYWYISYDDGLSWNNMGVRATGETGAAGRGITSIERTSTTGRVDTYTITYTDGTTSTFSVTNGADGGRDAYEIAVDNGYTGTYRQWLDSAGVSCAAEGHTYDTYTLVATCTQSGLTLRVCSVCGYAQAETSDKLSHSYTETVIPSTHDVNGYTKHVCSYCGDTYIDTLTALTPHDYTAEVTAPTCLHMGYTTYKCKLCSDEYVSDIVPAEEHSFKTKTIASSCTTEGFTVKTCEKCGYSIIEDETQAKGHNFEVTEKVEPTCFSKGYSVYTCKDCGVSYNADEVDMKAHTPGEWICEDPVTGRYVKRCENCYKLLETKTEKPEGDKPEGKYKLPENFGEQTASYNMLVTVSVTLEGIPEGAKVYIGEQEAQAEGDVYSAEIGNIKETTEIPIEVKQGDEVLDSSVLKINVKSKFFDKVISFFVNYLFNFFKWKSVNLEFPVPAPVDEVQ